jgi:hypothetical protein
MISEKVGKSYEGVELTNYFRFPNIANVFFALVGQSYSIGTYLMTKVFNFLETKFALGGIYGDSEFFEAG